MSVRHALQAPVRLPLFLAWFGWEVLRSNRRVLSDVLTRRDQSSAVVVRYRAASRSGVDISLLSILITLTPGTLVIATHRGRGYTLYVHSMYGHRESTLRSVEALERRLLHALHGGRLSRPPGGGE